MAFREGSAVSQPTLAAWITPGCGMTVAEPSRPTDDLWRRSHGRNDNSDGGRAQSHVCVASVALVREPNILFLLHSDGKFANNIVVK